MSLARAVRHPTSADGSRFVRPPGQRQRSGRGLAAYTSLLTVALLGASVFLSAPRASAAQPPVGLGTADSFAVLAGSGITNTGPTTITGDVGTFPTPSETGFGSVTLDGTNHGGDAVTQGAKDDLVAAYNDAAGRMPATNVPVELGGSTLLAGVYTSPTLGLTGTLTLDAEGKTDAEFIFQAGSTLIAESNSRVLLINGADPCRVVWKVGSSATFKTGTRFIGNVLSHMSITAQTSATFQGRLLARDGAVTLDTNTITKANCVGTDADHDGTSTSGGTTPTETSTATGGPTASSPGSVSTSTASPGSGNARPGSPTGTPSLAVGPPTATPATPPSATPTPSATPPSMAVTGVETSGLLRMAVALLALGAVGVVFGRRARTAQLA